MTSLLNFIFSKGIDICRAMVLILCILHGISLIEKHCRFCYLLLYTVGHVFTRVTNFVCLGNQKCEGGSESTDPTFVTQKWK